MTDSPKMDMTVRTLQSMTLEQWEFFISQLEKVIAKSAGGATRHRGRKTRLIIICSNGHVESVIPEAEIPFPVPDKPTRR